MGFLESNKISNFVVLTGDIHVRHCLNPSLSGIPTFGAQPSCSCILVVACWELTMGHPFPLRRPTGCAALQ